MIVSPKSKLLNAIAGIANLSIQDAQSAIVEIYTSIRGRGLLNDIEIAELAGQGMIMPFLPEKIRQVDGESVISFGLGHFGYDIRVANEFQVFAPPYHLQGLVDPKCVDRSLLHTHVGDFCIIPPNSFALARSLEYFAMPRNVLGICLGKSTYARQGVITNFTPFEPGWEGIVTIEISNSTPLPVKVYANEGIAQVLFFEGPQPNVAYSGGYQGQTGITLPVVGSG